MSEVVASAFNDLWHPRATVTPVTITSITISTTIVTSTSTAFILLPLSSILLV